jgi:hypothetical protein
MQKFALTIAAVAAVVAAGSMVSTRAEAMTATAPAGLDAAIDEAKISENVAYVCRRVWTGYGWRRSCWYTPSRYHYRPRYRHRYRYRW